MSLMLTTYRYLRYVHELADGKTSDGWKDSTNVAHASRSSNSYDQATLTQGMRTIPPIPPWLSPRVIKILGRTHGGCGERNIMKVKSVCDPKCENRSATCHTTCPIWLEYEAKRTEEYAERDKRRQGMYSTHDRRLVNAKYKYIAKMGKDVRTW